MSNLTTQPQGPPLGWAEFAHERTVRHLAAAGTLTVGIAWLADHFVLPILWSQLGRPHDLGPVFQRLDGLCLALEFMALAIVAVTVHRELRPATLLTRSALASAGLAAAVAVVAALQAMMTGQRAVYPLEGTAAALAGLWLIAANVRALRVQPYSRAVAWTGIGLGGLLLAAIAEYLLFQTGVTYAAAILMLLIWAALFAAAQFRTAQRRGWSAWSPQPPGRLPGPRDASGELPLQPQNGQGRPEEPTVDQFVQAQPHGQQEPQQGEQHQPPQQVFARRPQNSQGTASFILGLLAIVLSVAYFLSFWLAVAGLILGVRQRGLLRRGEATNRSMTRAGIVLSTIGLVLSIGVPLILSTVFGLSMEI